MPRPPCSPCSLYLKPSPRIALRNHHSNATGELLPTLPRCSVPPAPPASPGPRCCRWTGRPAGCRRGWCWRRLRLGGTPAVLRSTASRMGAALALEEGGRMVAALAGGSPPRRSSMLQRPRPRPSGLKVQFPDFAVTEFPDGGVRRRGLSRRGPPAPWTTRLRSEPRRRITSAHLLAELGEGDADELALGGGGVGQGARGC